MLTNPSHVREANVRSVADATAAGAPLIDVREQFEFQSGHAPQAVSMPMHLVPLRLDELRDDNPSAGPIYIVCRSGNRSWQVCHYLAQHGVDAVNVAGGMVSWQAAGLPVVQPNDPTAQGDSR
jgi:rhodanese-related sulfurtransferase